MIKTLLGLVILFLISCFFWTIFYLCDFELSEPPIIMKIIGGIELIIIVISLILIAAYFIGNNILLGLGVD